MTCKALYWYKADMVLISTQEYAQSGEFDQHGDPEHDKDLWVDLQGDSLAEQERRDILTEELESARALRDGDSKLEPQVAEVFSTSSARKVVKGTMF